MRRKPGTAFASALSVTVRVSLPGQRTKEKNPTRRRRRSASSGSLSGDRRSDTLAKYALGRGALPCVGGTRAPIDQWTT